jgi:hypothetical protein
MLLCWPIANAIFCSVKEKKYGEIIYTGDYFKTTTYITFSIIVPEWPRPDYNRFLWTGKTYSRAAQKIVYTSLRSSNILWPNWNYIWENNSEKKRQLSNRPYQGRKLYWSWSTEPMAALQRRSQFSLWKSRQLIEIHIREPAVAEPNQIRGPRKNSANFNIFYLSPRRKWHWRKITEEHLKNPKNQLRHLVILDSSIHLVTQSLN